MERRRAILAALAIVLALPLSSSVGQEGKPEKDKPPAPVREEGGSGIKAVVWQVDGTRSEIEDVQLFEEKIGILSLAKVPTSTYRMLKGKATLTIESWRILRIDILGDTVRVAGSEGEPVEGALDKNGRFFLTGRIGIGVYEVNLADCRTITFTHPAAKQLHCNACQRFYVQEWKYCPIDGARLKAVE